MNFLPYDLFGDVPVTWRDAEHWLRTVPRLDPHSPRAGYYFEFSAVASKIKRAKAAGGFLPTVAMSEPPLWWFRQKQESI